MIERIHSRNNDSEKIRCLNIVEIFFSIYTLSYVAGTMNSVDELKQSKAEMKQSNALCLYRHFSVAAKTC